MIGAGLDLGRGEQGAIDRPESGLHWQPVRSGSNCIIGNPFVLGHVIVLVVVRFVVDPPVGRLGRGV